jgi:hypothetical protein
VVLVVLEAVDVLGDPLGAGVDGEVREVAHKLLRIEGRRSADHVRFAQATGFFIYLFIYFLNCDPVTRSGRTDFLRLNKVTFIVVCYVVTCVTLTLIQTKASNGSQWLPMAFNSSRWLSIAPIIHNGSRKNLKAPYRCSPWLQKVP